ncbi:MAG: hypothetical protein ACRETX_15890, partial [Steroidobacteraceae bacterium]
GMISDVFVPRIAATSDMNLIRSTVRPSGAKLRAQLWTVPGGQSAADYAAQVLGDIQRLKPGVVELNIEVADAILHDYIRATVSAIRDKLPSRRLRVNIAPYKGVFLPSDRFQADPNLYAAEQTYYGDMSRVSEGEALLDLVEHGVPPARASLCYGAAGPTGYDSRGPGWLVARHCTLGTLYYEGTLVRKLRRGLIFQDDLLAEVGLL